MVRVRVWGSLAAAVGCDELAADADNVGALLAELRERYPALRPQLDRGVSVSVDGVIHSRSWVAAIGPDSEVVLLPRIEGG